MNWKEINEKLDRLYNEMHMSQRPMHYVDHYDEYQPDYQEDQVCPQFQWQQEQNIYQNHGQGYYQGNQSNQQGQGYFLPRHFVQQDQGNYQWNNYGNQRCYEEEMSNQNIGYTNPNKQGHPRQNTYPPAQTSEEDDMKSMMMQIMECQVRFQAEFTERIKTFERKIDSNHREEQAKFEDIYSHLKELENQLVQVASTSTNNEDGVHPEKPEADIEVIKEEDSLQKIHDGETSCLELKEELNAMELKEASNGKTSMEIDLSEPDSPKLELKPLPQELRYEFLSSNSTCPVIVNDALSKKKTKTFLAELILDSRWVPPVHVEPKKKKMTVVNKDQDELIPTRTITTHRMCINYRKLGATRKYHFPWPFTDQMLSTFSGFIENVVDVFIDDLSVYGDTFVLCLSSLRRVLKRCAETNIVLNWKKCYFMEREDTILGHTTPKKSIGVDKAEVDRPLSLLLYEDKSSEFNEGCLKAVTKIKRELVNKYIVHFPDWSFPFESGGEPKEPITA